MGCGFSSSEPEETPPFVDRFSQQHAPNPLAQTPSGTIDELPVLKAQPAYPSGTIVIIEARGGSDKKADGHRGDTIPICNAIIDRGWKAYPIFYSDDRFDEILAELSNVGGFIPRINPGTYEGVTNSKLNDLQVKLSALGVKAMSHPIVRAKMGAKDALVKIKDLACGMADTYAYYDVPTFKQQFPQTMATSPRVLKQNRGSQGEGIWICRLKDDVYPGGTLAGDTIIHLMEAVDNHAEERTLADFMSFCEKYIDGEEGQLIDMRFLPRIVEGEIRVNMIFDEPQEIIHKKPAEGGISATLASGAKYVSYSPSDSKFRALMDNFLNRDLGEIWAALGMDTEPLPLVWTTDFILGPVGEDGNDTYFVGEFNCSCVGITQQLHLASKVANAAIKVVSKTASAPPSPRRPTKPQNFR